MDVRCVSEQAGRALFTKAAVKSGEALAIIPRRLCVEVKDYTSNLAVGGWVDGWVGVAGHYVLLTQLPSPFPTVQMACCSMIDASHAQVTHHEGRSYWVHLIPRHATCGCAASSHHVRAVR